MLQNYYYVGMRTILHMMALCSSNTSVSAQPNRECAYWGNITVHNLPPSPMVNGRILRILATDYTTFDKVLSLELAPEDEKTHGSLSDMVSDLLGSNGTKQLLVLRADADLVGVMLVEYTGYDMCTLPHRVPTCVLVHRFFIGAAHRRRGYATAAVKRLVSLSNRVHFYVPRTAMPAIAFFDKNVVALLAKSDSLAQMVNSREQWPDDRLLATIFNAAAD